MTIYKFTRLTVPPTLEKQRDALEAFRTLISQDDEFVRQRRDEIAALRREAEDLRRCLDAFYRQLSELRAEILQDLKAQQYSPDQPRVPAGSAHGGEWTSGGEGGSPSDLNSAPERGEATSESGPSYAVPVNDSRVISDATPDNTWKPGAQYAGGIEENENRGRRPFMDGSPGQEARSEYAEKAWENVRNRMRTIDPYWRPKPGAYETIEGAIADLEAKTREAEAHIAAQARKGIGPGPFACEYIPAPSSGRLSTAERAENNENGNQYGCHTCGTTVPGTRGGNWVGDHQPPTRLNVYGSVQRIYPQCLGCSARQGGIVRDTLDRLR